MRVYLLGAGPGDPGLLTLKAKSVLERADVIVYDALANRDLLHYARNDAEILYVGKVANNHALPQPEINRLLVEKAREGKIVARLKGGDPYIFGRGGEEAQALLKDAIPFEEVPGISSTIAAPAYAGIPLTHRDLVSSVTFITGHEQPGKTVSSINWDALARSGSTLVFVMGVKNLPNIVANLTAAGLDPKTPSAIIYRGTTCRQRSLVAPLEDLARRANEEGFTNPSVIVVGTVVSLHKELNWFEQKPLLGKSIVITRAREQASELAELLAEEGAEVLQCPTITIQECQDTQPLHACLKHLADYQWIIFTSANAVRIFFTALEQQHRDARALGATKICAIGPGTANMLRHYGILCDLLPQKFVAESVADAFLAYNAEHLQGTRVLIPRAAKARDVLPKRLTDAGCLVDVLPVYETLANDTHKTTIEERLKDGTLSCITFTSSSTVQNFLKMIPAALLKHHPEVRLACIGPVTAATLKKEGLPCHIQPQEYTIPALVHALKQELA